MEKHEVVNFVDLILENKLDEAKEVLFDRLNEIVAQRMEEAKRYVAADRFEEVEELEEATRRNPNIIKMGRIQKIRRRIRRNAKGVSLFKKTRDVQVLKDIVFQVILSDEFLQLLELKKPVY